MEEYECCRCHETFEKGLSDEEAQKEYKESPWYAPEEETTLICDDCFVHFKDWFNSLSKEDREKYKGSSSSCLAIEKCPHEEYKLIEVEPDATGYVPYAAYRCLGCKTVIYLNEGDMIVPPARIVS